MSRNNNFSGILNLLLSLSLQSPVLASSPNIGRDPQHQRETSYSPKQSIVVTVFLHNYAHLPSHILSEAEDRASLIFRKAVVDVKWADCPLNDEDPALYPGCPEAFDGTQLFLRIFPTTATKMDHGGEGSRVY